MCSMLGETLPNYAILLIQWVWPIDFGAKHVYVLVNSIDIFNDLGNYYSMRGDRKKAIESFSSHITYHIMKWKFTKYIDSVIHRDIATFFGDQV